MDTRSETVTVISQTKHVLPHGHLDSHYVLIVLGGSAGRECEVECCLPKLLKVRSRLYQSRFLQLNNLFGVIFQDLQDSLAQISKFADLRVISETIGEFSEYLLNFAVIR